MAEKSDWRLTNQQSYLQGKTLYWRQYVAPSEDWDHDHCQFCWQKFGHFPDAQAEGWTTEDNYYWVCKNCCEDFREMFRWTLIGAG
jgi:hypothetical protein